MSTEVKAPSQVLTRPATNSTAPTHIRVCRADSGIATSSRIAATGGIAPARRAGRYAATIVTIMPTPYAMKAVLGLKTSGDPLRSRPNCANRVWMPMASRKPQPRPTVDPNRPTTNASKSTDRVTWRRPAPSARSMASSRLRWATRIENVLMMRNEPTNRAMPAKTSRKMLMKLSALLMPVADSFATALPVTASNPVGSLACTAAARSSALVPSFAVTQASVNSSLPP